MTNDTESMTLIKILELEHILGMKNSGVIYLCPNLWLRQTRPSRHRLKYTDELLCGYECSNFPTAGYGWL